MESWFIDLRKSLETPTSLVFSKELVNRFKKVGTNSNFLRQAACLFFNLIMVDSYIALYSCTAVVQVLD